MKTEMNTIINIFIGLSAFAGAWGIFIFSMKEGVVEVETNKFKVYRNIWTGNTIELRQGAHHVSPLFFKLLEEGDFKTTSIDPLPETVLSSDGLEIEVDYIFQDFAVTCPTKAVTKIDFKDREKIVKTRTSAILQDVANRINIRNIFEDSGVFIPVDENSEEKTVDGTKKEQVVLGIINNMEQEAKKLLLERVEAKIGIKSPIQVKGIKFPEKFAEVVEEVVTAKEEGDRIKEKAQAAGVPPLVMALGDIAYDIARMFKGGK